MPKKRGGIPISKLIEISTQSLVAHNGKWNDSDIKERAQAVFNAIPKFKDKPLPENYNPADKLRTRLKNREEKQNEFDQWNKMSVEERGDEPQPPDYSQEIALLKQIVGFAPASTQRSGGLEITQINNLINLLQGIKVS